MLICPLCSSYFFLGLVHIFCCYNMDLGSRLTWWGNIKTWPFSKLGGDISEPFVSGRYREQEWKNSILASHKLWVSSALSWWHNHRACKSAVSDRTEYADNRTLLAPSPNPPWTSVSSKALFLFPRRQFLFVWKFPYILLWAATSFLPCSRVFLICMVEVTL